jgi:Tol biopolymer transport system component
LRDFSFNAAGTRLAFSQSNDQAALWSIHLDRSGSPTAEPQPLIREHVRRFFSPSFSPDGSKIAYTWVQRDSEWVKMAIYAANADGTGVTPVSPEDQQTFSASWIDANSIGYQVTGKGDVQGYWRKPLAGPAEKVNLCLDWPQADNVRVRGMQAVADVQGADGRSVIVRADLAGSPPRSLTPSARDIHNPSWSPDGQWIAASEKVRGNTAVVIFPAQGGEIQTLVNEPGPSLAYGWSPDSRRISYSALRDGIWNVYWVDRVSHDVRQLTHFTSPSGLVRGPAWSPRGDQIIFERLDQFANIYLAEFGPK